MTKLPVLMMVGVLAVAAPAASEACRWLGTQLECELGERRMVLGTQAADGPSHARSFPVLSFNGDGGLAEADAASRARLEIDLQNFGADPRLCRKIGNETYCY